MLQTFSKTWACLAAAFLVGLLLPATGRAQYYDPYEPNDTFAQATVFAIPDTFRVDLDPAGDVDFYKFTGLRGDTVEIEAEWHWSMPASWIGIELYDSDQQTVLREAFDYYKSLIQFVLQHDGDYYIKVSSNKGGPDYDYSLSITGTVHVVYPTLTLTAPNGGEVWQGLSTQYITWTTGGEGVERIDHIKLLMSTDGGSTFPNVITESTPNTGSYEWTVPFINSSTVRVKAQAMDASDAVLAEDESDADFTITTEAVGPQLLWTYQASALIQWLDHWEDGFATGDLNDDGIPDVVFGTKAGEVVTVNGVTGTELWTFPIPNTTESVNADIVDVDGDGELDVVAGGRASVGNVTIVALDKNGNVKWEASGDYQEVTDFAYGDINGDGYKDVVASIGTYPWYGGQVVLLDGRDGSRIWDAYLGGGIAFAIDARDVDGDGDMEVAVTNYNKKVFLIDGATNSIVWEKEGSWYGRDVIIADVDNDGDLEVVACVSQAYCYEADGAPVWSISQGEGVKACDVNNDGKRELVMTTPWTGITYLIDGATGSQLWARTEAGASDVGDINGDGIDEIVTGTLKYYEPDVPSHYVAAVDSQNNLLWKYDLSGEPNAVVVANIDQDETKEVLVVIDSTLIALDVTITPGVEALDPSSVPSEYELSQNYPNPFNSRTRIEYQVSVPSHVSLRIYNAMGQVVKTLIDSYHETGKYVIYWNGLNDAGLQVNSGVYFLQMRAGRFIARRKMVLLR